MEHLGINVETFTIDIADYELYLKKANYAKYRYIKPTAKIFPEKTLEHYIAAKLLNLQKADTYIDVASSASPAPDIYNELYNCTSYKQDLIYPNGLHGNVIGGDACQMPLPDGFANKIALHCSFEHFEQDADTKFIKEATRVLAKNGKLCIIPLYLADQYGILTTGWGATVQRADYYLGS
ncbi:MAG: class I SAM-dependent methyltransferase [Chloroflexi bacterium]|nr:class I SAM-dependent methyltransferase [Chloroflexota bacterium]